VQDVPRGREPQHLGRNDSLLPKGEACDACHSTDHSELTAVKAGDDATSGQCAYCHEGYKPGDGNAVAELAVPRANLLFNHKAHVDRNIGCAQCHGAVDQLELATRDQLPADARLLHVPPDARLGVARRGQERLRDVPRPWKTGARDQDHVRQRHAEPPRWLHNAEHTPDFIERHKSVAADDSQFCANCHKEDFCTDCHDGRVRPRSIHPNDYLNMHAIEARMETQKCKSCHQEQSFCLDCHMRVGVSESSPAEREGQRRASTRPRAIWSDPPVKPGSHSSRPSAT
jgi:hypothetical protein